MEYSVEFSGLSVNLLKLSNYSLSLNVKASFTEKLHI